MKKALARAAALLVVAPAILVVIAGCGKPEDPKPPSGSTYYTGPMTPKGQTGAGAQSGQQGSQ
jgi:hypothetical protein